MQAKVRERKGWHVVGSIYKYKYIYINNSCAHDSLVPFAILVLTFCKYLLFCSFVANPCIYNRLAPPSFSNFWESWAQHPQISCKLLISKDFPMPKIKKGILGIASKKRQSIYFKQIFSRILGKALIFNKFFLEVCMM